jgi:hypothetical protein
VAHEPIAVTGVHNWKDGGTAEGTRSLDVMKLERAGYLSDASFGGMVQIRLFFLHLILVLRNAIPFHAV